MVCCIALADHLACQLAAEAQAAFPRECCGLIEGRWQGAEAMVGALHPMANCATEPDRFAIDPARQIALLRQLRGRGQRIIGCYHSHPNGLAEPSGHDGAGASQEGFIWLIQPVFAGIAGRPGAFLFQNATFATMRFSHSPQR